MCEPPNVPARTTALWAPDASGRDYPMSIRFRTVTARQVDGALAGAAEFEPRAVDRQVHGTGAWPGANHVQALGPATERRVVWHGEFEAEQTDDGANQPFGLPQRQTEHRPQRQRRCDGQGRIARLTASSGPRLSFSCSDRRAGEPHRQAAALTQSSIVGGRVRDPVPLLWDVVATLGVGFERHDNPPQNVTGVCPQIILSQPRHQRSLQQNASTHEGRRSLATPNLRVIGGDGDRRNSGTVYLNLALGQDALLLAAT